jgi:glycosyltransferase involved in cell wall biosynthesis
VNGQRLDVVVPAYRARYLQETLESLACQDDRAFRVLVGDDASPDDLAGLCARFAGRMDIVHHRFPDNMGAHDLVGQWTRCVALGDSPWVWLFSDDDVASAGCVGALRRALGEGAVVARLDLAEIGASGEVLDLPPEPPARESRELFLWQRLKRRRESFVVEYAFRRDRWEAAGGFVSLPAAWCSDDATWWRLAGSDGIRHAAGGRVGWRWSGANISSSHRRDAEKREGCLRFLELVGRDGLAGMEAALGLAPGAGADAAMDWLRFHLGGLRAPVGWSEARAIEARMARVAGSRAEGLAGTLRRGNCRLWIDRIRGRLR